MRTPFKKSSRKSFKKFGIAPGELVFAGEKKEVTPRIHIMDYGEDLLTERDLISIEEAFPLRDTKTCSWINVDGLHDIKMIEKIQNHFNIHPLVTEDILHTHQRPKFEDMEDYIFAVLKMISFNSASNEINSEQVSFILGPKYVISFQERTGDVFDPVRERIRKAKGRVRKAGPDFLLYALIDIVIDNYFVVLDNIAEKIEELEEEVMNNPSSKTLNAIHSLKSSITTLRKSVWPLREMVGNMSKSGSELINEKTDVYLRDLYDHTIQVTDSMDTYRDMLSGLMDVYLSSISNKMNEVMKVLTIFAAIFIPLTFIAGVYGMNFEYMPELKWKFSYPILWGFMICAAVSMLILFKKKKWL